MASNEKRQRDFDSSSSSSSSSSSGDRRQKEYLYRNCERDEKSGFTYLEKERVVLDIKMQEDVWNTLHGYEMKEDYRPEEIYVICGKYMYLGQSPTRRPLGQMQSDDSIRRLISLLDGVKHTGTLLWKIGSGAGMGAGAARGSDPGVLDSFADYFLPSKRHGEAVDDKEKQEEGREEENEMQIFAEHDSSRKELVDDRQQDGRQDEEESNER